MTNLSEQQHFTRPPVVLDDARRTRCEIWTRVMGYHRPTASFNVGKQGEFQDRLFFRDCKSS